MTTVVFQVADMSCQNCAKHVTEAVRTVQSTAEVNVDLATGKVSVSGAPADPAAIAKAITDAGYPARLAG